ncbi:rifin PIR protein, putative [Plasmodium reichenowi]|uniref:Rifin PIR protein, putative n=1 Tax=Plasmodium reichenowi TaxID=5854 RepID=A0A2P9DSE0_PLARE|nr:rifin PIR protein, putative [Plasmodium reichenowi]
MKLHYSKILLFVFPLTILLTSSSYEHNKNKPYTTQHHTPIYTSRVLSEKDTQSSIYDKDADMKSVKENFHRQTSQRFEEYEERMKDKRQKRKEERNKNIQKIIEKDKKEKSLAEKVEKCCLKCGCTLGGVAASVGIFGTVAVKELAKAAIATAMVEGEAAAIATAAEKGTEAGIKAVIEGITREFGVSSLGNKALLSYFTETKYTDVSLISSSINIEYNQASCLRGGNIIHKPICTLMWQKSKAAGEITEMTQWGVVSDRKVIETTVKSIVSDANIAAAAAEQQATEEAIKASTLAIEAKYASCQTAIIASVVALLIIVLVMIIIYLVLRYRRKKKMNKKAQYTKLLNQ